MRCHTLLPMLIFAVATPSQTLARDTSGAPPSVATRNTAENQSGNLGVIQNNGTVIFNQHATSKEKTIDQFRAVLTQINMSVVLRRQYLLPALEEYMNKPSAQNWRMVTTSAKRLRDQIENGIRLAIAYDSELPIAETKRESQELISFVDQNTPTVTNGTGGLRHPQRNGHFGRVAGSWNENVAASDEIVETRLPTIEQVQEWHAGFLQRAQRLEAELKELLKLIETRS